MRRLSFLPLSFVLWWVSADVMPEAAVPSPDLQSAALERWGKDVAALEVRDAAESHPADSILFVGSSSIRLWKTMGEDMAPYHPIQRGYGGAKFSDLAVFAERLITPHRFQALVIFVVNDVTGGAFDATPEQVSGWFGHLVEVARAVEPDARVFCISTGPRSAPSRRSWPASRSARESAGPVRQK